MTQYTVTFFKRVLSSNGHPFKAPQEKIEIWADTPEQAMKAAQRRFASIRRIPSWQHHADTVEIAARKPTPSSEKQIRLNRIFLSTLFPERGALDAVIEHALRLLDSTGECPRMRLIWLIPSLGRTRFLVFGTGGGFARTPGSGRLSLWLFPVRAWASRWARGFARQPARPRRTAS